MGTEENLIQKSILEYLRKRGIYAWRNNQAHVPGRSFTGELGVSDILGCYKGRFLAIEVKTPKGSVKDYQKDFLARINNLGGIGILARSLEDVIKGLEG